MKNKYTFPGKQKITFTFVDGNYLWIAFYGISSICDLQKNSIFNPNLCYWDVDVTGNEIKSIIDDVSYLYLALDHLTYLGAKVNKITPSSISYFVKQESIEEEAIDLVRDDTYIYFLIPGILSGTNTKICKYNKSTRAFVETIDLNTVFNAKKIDIDNSEILWVVSDLDSIPKITKIWYDITWQFQTYILS